MQLFGQDPYYVRIDKSQGLPSNAVYDLFQDSKGFMWFATEEGICRYDGKNFETYISPIQTSRASTCIKEDKYGRIWFTNFDSRVYYIEHGEVKAIQRNPPSGVFLKYFISDKYVMVPQLNGIDIFNLKTLKLVKTVSLKYLFYTYGCGSLLYIEASDEDEEGMMTDAMSVYTLDDNFHLEKQPYKLPNNDAGIISCMDNTAYICSKTNTRKKIYTYHPQKGENEFPFTYNEYIANIAFTDDDIWICTKNGVYKKNKKTDGFTHYYSGKFISCVLKDRDGNYWISTTNEGVLFVPSLSNNYFLIKGFRPYKMQATGNEIMVSGRNSIIMAFNPNNFSSREIFNTKNNHETSTFQYDSLTKKLLVSSDIFYNIHEKNITEGLSFAIKDLCRIDDSYYAYAASGANGLYKYNHDGPSSEWDSLFNARLNPVKSYDNFASFIDNCRGKSTTYNRVNKQIYYSTNVGLYSASPYHIQELKYKNATLQTRQVVFYGEYVLALQNNGTILKIDKENNIKEYPFLLNGEMLLINKIILREASLFVITNSNGVYLIDLANPQFVPKKMEEVNDHGEINDIILWNDKYIISESEGILILEKNNHHHKKINPQFILGEMTVNGASVNIDSSISMSYNQNDIKINYSILSYNTNFTYPLYYRINDGAWKLTPSESRQLELVSLQPEKYKIDFRLGDKGSVQSLNFTINKPIWQVHWFWLGISCVVLSIVFLIYRWRLRSLSKRNQLLLEKVELEKNLNKSILTSIKAQMNPHFFYNALNTIQAFIFANDKKNASTYLHKFSKLTRLILEMSEKETITLSEEIQALQLYLDIEKARFNDKLNYQIHVSENIETEIIKIQPMLIQPYVENAIKHGLLHKKEDCNLSINFELKNNMLMIVVDDDGVGRIKSATLNAIKENKHQSFATAANQKRLEILNGGDKQLAVEFIDKYDEAGNATGTTVIITLPLNM